MISYKNTNKEIEEHNPTMAIQPLGSTEQHGPHLPVCTDAVIALEVSKAMADHFKALLLPPIPYSCSLEHRGYKSTIWISPITLYLTVKDIVEALKFHGFKTVVIVNGHGGNFALKNIVRELNYMFDNNPLIILVDIGSFCLKIGEGIDIHAGDVETSLMIYLKPELVKEVGKNYVPKVPRDYLNYMPMKEVTKEGIWGFPENASKERGKEIFTNIVREAISYVENVLKLMSK